MVFKPSFSNSSLTLKYNLRYFKNEICSWKKIFCIIFIKLFSQALKKKIKTPFHFHYETMKVKTDYPFYTFNISSNINKIIHCKLSQCYLNCILTTQVCLIYLSASVNFLGPLLMLKSFDAVSYPQIESNLYNLFSSNSTLDKKMTFRYVFCNVRVRFCVFFHYFIIFYINYILCNFKSCNKSSFIFSPCWWSKLAFGNAVLFGRIPSINLVDVKMPRDR